MHSSIRNSCNIVEFVVNGVNLSSNTLFPLCLLNFKKINYFHNCLVDYRASMNIIPVSIAKKINAKCDKIDAQIIHLDRLFVQTLGELINVNVPFSSDHKVH